MNTPSRLLITPVVIGAAALVFAGCSRKEEAPPEPAATSTEVSKPAPAQAPTATPAPAPAQAQTRMPTPEQLNAAAAQQAAAVSQMAAAAGEAAKKESQAASAQVQQAASSLAATQPQAPAAAAQTKVAAPQSDASLQAQAAELLSRYSGELETITKNVAAVKALIDKNASVLPAGIRTKYQELNALLPQLGSLVTSLKNYQTADLSTLVPKLQSDFAKARNLYGEIRDMLPESLSLPAL